MRTGCMFGLVALAGCQPPPSSGGGRAVIEVYKHANGVSNCVEYVNKVWKADPSCCPEGFEVAGYSTPAATAYVKIPDDAEGEDKNDWTKAKESRRMYRHLVCLEKAAAAPTRP